MAARYLAWKSRYAAPFCPSPRQLSLLTHLVLCLLTPVAPVSCKHTSRGSGTAGASRGQPDQWADISTETDGKTRVSCPTDVKDVDDGVQCAFHDRSSGLIWTSRAPGADGFRESREFLPWSAAQTGCEKLGKWAGIEGWRLPTDAELNNALPFRTLEGRSKSPLSVHDYRRPSLTVPKSGFIWAGSNDATDAAKAMAAFRGASGIALSAVSKDVAGAWYCVTFSPAMGLVSDAKSTTQGELGAPTKKSPTLPAVAPPDDLGSLGNQRFAGNKAEKKLASYSRVWAIVPLTNLDSLSLVPLKGAMTPQPAPKLPVLNESSQSNGGKASAKSPQNSETHVPELNLSDADRDKIQSKMIGELQSIFEELGLARSIDDRGHLVLNPSCGVNFPVGSYGLSESSLANARRLIGIYLDHTTKYLGNSSVPPVLVISGFTNPSRTGRDDLSRRANQKVSRKRAEIIKNAVLTTKKWPMNRIVVDGRGDDEPLVRIDQGSGACGVYDCDLSRRVEVYLVSPEPAATGQP